MVDWSQIIELCKIKIVLYAAICWLVNLVIWSRILL